MTGPLVKSPAFSRDEPPAAGRLQVDCLAHACQELVAPLSLLNGYLETLSLGVVTGASGVARCIPVMERNVRRLMNVTSDMRLFVSVVSGAELKFAKLDIRLLIGQVVGKLEEITTPETTQFSVDIPADQPALVADLWLLEHSITSLAELLMLSCTLGDQQLNFQGRWLGENYELRITDPRGTFSQRDFEAIENGAAGLPAGNDLPVRCTGVGVRLTRQAIKAHGGYLSIDYQPDFGTTIIIQIPQAHSISFQ